MSDLSQLSMQELFRMEAESNTQILVDGLLALERNPAAAGPIENCMRAAHSLKGAARLVDIEAGVQLAHAMEDFLVAAQQGRLSLRQDHIDVLLRGVDLMMAITRNPDVEGGAASQANRHAVEELAAQLSVLLNETANAPVGTSEPVAREPAPPPETPAFPPRSPETPAPFEPVAPTPETESSDRALRVTVDNLNRLLGLAGETLVESRRLKPFRDSLLRLKRLHQETAKAFDRLKQGLPEHALGERGLTAASDARRWMLESQQFLAERLLQLEESDSRSTRLAQRLYDQALACRMRPFADGVVVYPRLVRDIARRLGRQVRLEVIGASTMVDRDILERLDAPLGHLLRNAVDHGIEPADERLAAGKPPEGLISIEARHSAGTLQIVISDDGRGVDFAGLRNAIVDRKLASAENVGRMSESELLQFLFLPGFTMKQEVTEISGRGVGLDVVQDMIRSVRGVVRMSSQKGCGARFHLQLPLTLSVVRALLVEIDGEPYAFPLAFLTRAIKLRVDRINTLEGHQFFEFEGEPIGLVAAHQVLALGEWKPMADNLAIVIVGEHASRYGLVVDKFLGERELVLQPLDPRLGMIKDVSAAALLEDGTPVLVIDVEDMIRSMEKLASADRLHKIEAGAATGTETARKRILVVDDSLTVRELERKLLDHRGYQVDVAVDGMDGWNAVRNGKYNLVVTDIDMPRMDGIELVTLIKRDLNLRSLPVMILSYKDREEDRQRGLEAGADYYLTKGSFHDDTLIDAVVDLIGEPVA
jgi:two-component system sensor histidine kinase and response regulator WspE